jgi:uncharacterized membrane protein
MQALIRLFQQSSRLQTLALIAILAVGTAARVYVMSHYEPEPGDGLLRALMADWWVRGLWPLDTEHVDHNHAGWAYLRLPITGPWPPGHFVLAGLFVLIFKDPVFATSLLSLLCGTLSIWLVYHIATKTFGVTVGLISAATLSLLPLHVTLSTNPLAEIPAVLFLLVIVAVVLKGMEVGFSTPWLITLFVMTFVGTMIRYELWLTLPAISAAYWYARRSVWRTCLVSILASLGPLLWMLSSWIHYGNPLASFQEPLGNAEPIGALAATSLTIEKISAQTGYFIAVASALGITLILAGFRVEGNRDKRVFYLTVFFLQLAFFVWFTDQRSGHQADRYVLFTVVLIIPMAAYALLKNGSLIVRCLVGATIVGSMLFAEHIQGHKLYIRPSVPDAVSEAAAWLGTQLEPGQTFISTQLRGDAHTLGLRTRSTPYNVAYQHNSDEEIAAIWNAAKPSYVVILADEEPADRLLQQFESQIDLSDPPTKFGQISIYRVKHNDRTRLSKPTTDG